MPWNEFAQAFPDQIGSWCEMHGVAMTGHLMEEQNLRVLTVESGEPMRLYRGFTIPGIDMLCDAREYQNSILCWSHPGYPYYRFSKVFHLQWQQSAGHTRQADCGYRCNT